MRRPSSLRGRVLVSVLAVLLVLLGALFATVDTVLTARLHADLRTRLTDRATLAAQLDGALSPQQLVDRLRGDGVTALLCSPAGSGSGSGGRSGAGSSGSGSSGSGSSGETSSVSCVSAADAAVPATGPAAQAVPGPAGRPKPVPKAAPKAKPSAVQATGPLLYVRTTLPSSGQVLTLSVDGSQVGATMHRLILLELAAGLVALLLAAVLLARVVGSALRPLDELTTLARGIAGGDRGRRLGTGRPDTELGRTAQAFDEMLDELESALAAAAEAQARLHEFLNDVSHELRTPLAGVAATSEVLLRDEPGRAERERAYVSLVRESRRAGRLVQDLLTTTRIDSGESLDLAAVDLVEIARDEAQRAGERAPGLTLEVSGAAHVPLVADPLRVGQIVANLLDNARAATGGHGRVGIEVGVVEVGADACACHLTVTDSGPGVADEDRERIFERLVRLDPARSVPASGGFGLGLAIARSLARAHGGDLVCLPARPGRGAAFRLVLYSAPASSGTDGGRSSALHFSSIRP